MKPVHPDLLRHLADILRAGGIEDAALEAKWIAEDAETPEQAEHIAKRRAKHEPLQYLLGTWEFYGLTLSVGKGVLIPRADTETLVDAVLERMKGVKNPKIADLCTGSGCIALALAAQRQDADITGIELSPDALHYAETNCKRLKLPVQFVRSDVLDAETARQRRQLDGIVCNPPYLTAEDMAHLQEEVRYEPASALAGGEDGLHFYREITRLWRDSLKEGGLLAYETGCTQTADVTAILEENGFSHIETVRDLAGLDRVVLGRRNTV